MADWIDRAACLLFPLESGCLAAAAAAGRGDPLGVALAETGEAIRTESGSIITDAGDAAAQAIGASAEPLANVAETVRWATIGIIALSVVVLVLVGLAVFFYLRGFR